GKKRFQLCFVRNFPRGRGKRPAYVGGKPSSTHPKAAKKKPRPKERGAKRAPPRRGSVWQVTTPSNGAALMRSHGSSDENMGVPGCRRLMPAAAGLSY